MGYEPTNWKDGDLVTSAKLNKLEQGVASSSGGVLMVHMNEGVLDKTWKAIEEAMQEKIVCILLPVEDAVMHAFASSATVADSEYIISAFMLSPYGTLGSILFVTNSEDGYPMIEDNTDHGGKI